MLALTVGCASAPTKPSKPVEPVPLVVVSPIVAVRAGAPLPEGWRGALLRDLHKGLVAALRRRGHQVRTGPPLPTLHPPLPPMLGISGSDPVLATHLHLEHSSTDTGSVHLEASVALGLYHGVTRRMVWSNQDTWSKDYPELPDPADVADDLLDGLLQRATPKEDEAGPGPLLDRFPPAVEPPHGPPR